MANRRDPMGIGLAVLNRIASSPIVDKLKLRASTEKAVYRGAKGGFRVAGAAGRTFKRVKGSGKPTRLSKTGDSGVFDLTPTEDQQMIVGVIKEFAAEVLRPGALVAETSNDTPKEVLAQTSEFGLTLLNIPEALGGLSEDRSAVTGVLVAEALAEGDMGQAVACLAPAAVATAISLWGSDEQQQTYLPAFAGDDIPTSALAVSEPRVLFDPFELQTKAERTANGLRINGVKSAVVRGAEAELFVVAVDLDGSPTLVLIESSTKGVSIEADPSMGLRAAGLSRLVLEDVDVEAGAVLGDGSADDYRECIRLSRLAWSGLALGTSRAVLDYVSDYVKTREAFGEPISHRQAVAFMVADIAIELEGMRLTTLKAASRAEQGMDFSREVALARRLTAEYGMKIGTDGVQLLGGHGFVKEHPVERWYRDLRAVGLMEGAVLV
ncbi:alkylation response protein AidB-like acyl-CoA dehydrogenase [Aeromicrobium panaciterrae]|uniref:Alkylation response protein AidB-like acyl-CoA dehydrogenase n=1 Tax=Aeromicrobium panaciterrae TaxID=363861 RepID=A0ABU1UP55_9ACTN|nr:acyl-CoA dehydrogenase family protein [Aeromicrobium panaciterrae]MDR7086966.1 alkylation response protein AidB-like acyl-CoA dehydrogenase [Aeromicrobium panaciterrae]